VRGCILGGRAVFTEACSLQFQPAYSAGMMSVFAIAMWLHQRGMPVGVCIGIWMVDCVLMVIGQFLFLYHLSAGVRNRAAGVSVMQQLWTMAVPPWFVPLVGISAAAANGGAMIRASGVSEELAHLALYGPLALGGLWMALMLLPIYFKATWTGSLWNVPPSAILMAPAALNLAGWLGAIGPTNLALRDSWLTHALAIVVLVSSVPIALCVPRYLDVRKPFEPLIATVGFPLEIGAISLTRYQGTLATPLTPASNGTHGTAASTGLEDDGSRPLWRGAAWLLVGWASMAALVIWARFAAAALRALCRGQQALAAATPAPMAADGMEPHTGKHDEV